MLRGLVAVVDPSEIAAVVNTGDDIVLHGLHVCPDLDTVTYTLAGAANPDTGWGLVGETWAAMDALERYGGLTWFRLGDRDLATHLYRTQRLAEGATLSAVTGPADRMLAGLGHEPSVVGVARIYAPLAATLVVDEADADLSGAVEAEGMRCVVTPTVMDTPEIAAGLARTVLAA